MASSPGLYGRLGYSKSERSRVSGNAVSVELLFEVSPIKTKQECERYKRTPAEDGTQLSGDRNIEKRMLEACSPPNDRALRGRAASDHSKERAHPCLASVLDILFPFWRAQASTRVLKRGQTGTTLTARKIWNVGPRVPKLSGRPVVAIRAGVNSGRVARPSYR